MKRRTTVPLIFTRTSAQDVALNDGLGASRAAPIGNRRVDAVIEVVRANVDAELEACELVGDCETESEVWARHLRAHGLRVKHRVGFWEYADIRVPHQWLIVEGDLFDPTAWQFYELEGVPADAGAYNAQDVALNGQRVRGARGAGSLTHW